MHRDRLREMARRNYFNPPTYTNMRKGPDHAPRFKAAVIFNGERFQCLDYWPTLQQAENASAEVAIDSLAKDAGAHSSFLMVEIAAGVITNLLMESAHRAGFELPVYRTVLLDQDNVPVYKSSVQIAGLEFDGEPAASKKLAQKSAAMAAWSALKKLGSSPFAGLPSSSSAADSGSSSTTSGRRELQEQAMVYWALSKLKSVEGSDRRQFPSPLPPPSTPRATAPLSPHLKENRQHGGHGILPVPPPSLNNPYGRSVGETFRQRHLGHSTPPPDRGPNHALPVPQPLPPPPQASDNSRVNSDQRNPSMSGPGGSSSEADKVPRTSAPPPEDSYPFGWNEFVSWLKSVPSSAPQPPLHPSAPRTLPVSVQAPLPPAPSIRGDHGHGNRVYASPVQVKTTTTTNCLANNPLVRVKTTVTTVTQEEVELMDENIAAAAAATGRFRWP